MFQDKYVSAQLTTFLDRNHFNYLVRKYGGDKSVKHFTCWNQLLALMFGQLSNRESLRDLIVALEAHQGKTYHLGLGKHITRSNLAKLTKIVITTFLRHMPIIWSNKQEASVKQTYSNLVEMCTPLTLQPLTFV